MPVLLNKSAMINIFRNFPPINFVGNVSVKRFFLQNKSSISIEKTLQQMTENLKFMEKYVLLINLSSLIS